MIDLAVWVATHHQGLLIPRTQIPLPTIERYWSASKCRLDRWGRSLKQLQQSTASEINHVIEFRPLLIEILSADVLTRVWSAVLCAHDRHRGTSEVEPVARSVLIGQLEARHRALTYLLDHSGSDLGWAVQANRVRLQTDRWTDLLIGLISEQPGSTDFAVDRNRVIEFGLGCGQRSSATAALVGAGVRASSRHLAKEQSPNADLNATVASSILGCFPTAAFDSVGVPRPHGYWRLRESSQDLQLVEESAAPRRLATTDRLRPGRVFWPGSNRSE